MRSIQPEQPCPCWSGDKYSDCCAPYLAGERWPPSPELVMRSRYSAYATGNVEHLFRTTHPENAEVRPVTRREFCQQTLVYCKQVNFTRLTVHQAWPEDEAGMARVRFTVDFTVKGQRKRVTELSDFVRYGGHWVYRDGRAD